MNTSGSSPSAPPGRFTFRKAERLCSRRLLGELFKQGVAFNTYPLRFVVWRTEAGTSVSDCANANVESGAIASTPASFAADVEDAKPVEPRSNKQQAISNKQKATRTKNQETLQVVLSVSKRYFKRAHDRNYIKRLLREAWRHHKPALLAALPARLAATQSALEPAPEPALPGQPVVAANRPSEALLVAVLYIGKENPESLLFLRRRLRKGLDRLLAELPAAAAASPA